MYRVQTIQIKKGHKLHDYCSQICSASASLYNRANFLVRQHATAVRDFENMKPLTENQMSAYELIHDVTAGTKYEPNKWLSYGQLDYILKKTDDRDYKSLPSQANQQILKSLIRDYKSFFEAVKTYSSNPSSFTGKPKMPGYLKDDRLKTAVLTNQICRVKNGRYIKFPGTKIRLNAGTEITSLKEVRIKPRNGIFEIGIVYEVPDIGLMPDEKTMGAELEYLAKIEDVSDKRILAIDMGVNNFCAIVNNFGDNPMLIKGGRIKSANQFYNKKLAFLKSRAIICNGRLSTKRIDKLNLKRDNIMKDMLHKMSRSLADLCRDGHIDIVVLGHNKLQKQDVSIGHVNNQSFVQIPYMVFAGMLKYKLSAYGIKLIMTEESYTSKADFLAGDYIPVYGSDDKNAAFSGSRIKRGLYKHFDGSISNADINGAANILRKAFPKVTRWDRGIVDMPCVVSNTETTSDIYRLW